MKKKFSLCIISFFILIAIYLLHLYIVDKKLNYQPVVIATRTIEGRTLIDETMVKVINVPYSDSLFYYYSDINDVIGKYNDIDARIYQGEYLFKDKVSNIDNLIDKDHLLLEDNYSTYGILVDLATSSGNTLIKGQYVNLYASIYDESNNIIVDEVLKDLLILGIRDYSGLDINDPNSSKVPYIINIAVKSNYIPLLIEISEKGKMMLYVSSGGYNLKESSILKEDSKILIELNSYNP